MAESRKRQWIYVVGDGRSGSTLLGSLVAGELGAFDCGELHLLWTSRVDGRVCACGVEVAHCPVWDAVAARVRDDLGVQDDEALADLARARLRQRQLLGVRLPAPPPGELALRRATEAAIETVTSAAAIVDTSKLSSVLWTASRLSRPLRVVHLVRDPRAVAFSWSRPTPDPSRRGEPMERKSTVRSATDWLRAHATTERVLRRLDREVVVRLRYEDLVADPAGAIRSILGDDGAGAGGLVAFGSNAGGPSHAVAGNPTRFASDQRVVPDERWRREMTAPARAVATALTAPLLPRFGYRLRSGSD